MNSIKLVRSLAIPAAVAALLAAGGCGGNGIDDDKAKDIREQGEKITERGAQVQKDAAKLAADVKAGRITQAEADAKLKKRTDAVVDDAKKASGDAIDLVQDADGVPDDAKKALEEAQKQIEAP